MWSYVEQVDALRKHFNGEFKELRRTSTKAILMQLLREDLILHPSIRARVDHFKANRFNQKTVGVHVRYTDEYHRVKCLKTRLPSIRKKLNALLKREPEIQVVLATDNVEIKEIFQEVYPNVITTQKWYPASGSSMHKNPECPDRVENGIDALVDMYLLAQCDYLILDGNSSFSYLASLLTDAPSSRIFNVQRGRWQPQPVRYLIWLLKFKLRQLTS